MRRIFLITMLLLTFHVAAKEAPSEQFMSLEQQTNELDTIANDIRKSFWQSGHDDVTSATYFMKKSMLDENVSRVKEYEDFLGQDEVAQLYKCYNSKSCELYLIFSSGSYWGGYGETAHYILLYTKSGKYLELSHIIYSE
jgi:hypothetical protein